MFIWNVADMELRRHNVKINNTPFFSAESNTSREDKIAFVDSMNDGALTYLLSLLDQFEKDESAMPRDQWNSVKTVSLIAWCKRNDPRGMIDRTWKYGMFRLLGTERYITSDRNHKGPWDHYGDLVDEMFHRQLIDCMRKEETYFKEHDPHQIALYRVRDYIDKYHTDFGIHLAISSKDIVCLVPDGDMHKYMPQLTLEQCNFLIAKYEDLDRLIEGISKDAVEQFSNI